MKYEQLVKFQQEGSRYLQENPNTKLAYAIKKVGAKIEKILIKESEEITDKLEDARIDNCSTDEKGNILKDEKGQYVFTKEGLKAYNKKSREIKTEVVDKRENLDYEIESYVATDIPKLTPEQAEAFSGLVIPEVFSISGPFEYNGTMKLEEA